jgi:hypothetical protein
LGSPPLPLELLWRNHWNLLSAKPPIQLEIAVEGDDGQVRLNLRHANQARIGKRDGYVLVLGKKLADGKHVIVKREVWKHETTLNEVKHGFGTGAGRAEKEAGLRKHSLAGKQGRGDPVERLASPPVKRIPAVQEGNERAGVDGETLHLP